MLRPIAAAALLLALLVPTVSADNAAESAQQRSICVTIQPFDYTVGPYHITNSDRIDVVCVYCPDNLDFLLSD